MYYNGSTDVMYWTGATGDMVIENTANDKDIILKSDDGSGGTTPYITLDGSATDIKIAQHMQFADNKELRIGNDNDLRLVSNNSNTFIDNYLGAMFIRQTVDDQDIIFQCDDGSGGLATYLTLDGSANTVNIAKPTSITSTTANQASINYDASTRLQISVAGSGVTTFLTDNTAASYFTNGLGVPTNTKLYLDGGGDTYIFEHSANVLEMWVGNENLLQLSSGGEISYYNKSKYDRDLTFCGDTNDHVLYFDAGAERIGILESSPSTLLHFGTAPDARVITFDQSGRYSGIGTYFSSGSTASRIDFFLSSGATDGTTNQEFAMYSSGDFHADADVIAYSSSVGSDRKLKKNIKDTPYGLDDVLKMRAVEFDWKEKRQGKHDIGVIAQEIEKIIPEVVQEVQTLKTDGDTHKVVDYGKLTSVLIKAIQEQQVEIDCLKANLEQLKYNRR
jgi:hypothetical protein